MSKTRILELLDSIDDEASERAGEVRAFVEGVPDSDSRFTRSCSNAKQALGYWAAQKNISEVVAKVPEGGAFDESPRLIQALLQGLGLVSSLPRDAQEFASLLQDTTGMKIPISKSAFSLLQTTLTPDTMQLFQQVPGYHAGLAHFSLFLTDNPDDAGKEGTTMLLMQNLFRKVWSVLGRYSNAGILPQVRYNLTERGAGSTSGVIGSRLRPDLVIVINSCTALLGEDKEENHMRQAQADMINYVKGGLPVSQYGSVPGLPAYAASGMELQFLYISRQGQVQPAGTIINLGTLVGRQRALRAVIQCYRLVVAIERQLTPLMMRQPLWVREERGDAEVTLTPQGAVKIIHRFKAFARKHGVSQESVSSAYQVAETAAQEQRRQGQPPYLIAAAAGTLNFTRSGFQVSTTPLGYKRDIRTVADARRLAISCLCAARDLHEKGLVYTDFRTDNIVWLDDEHCMVIDLETCRQAAQPLPEDVEHLKDWDNSTLEQRDSSYFFTPASDLYQIGKMLQQLQPVQQSELAVEFVRLLKSRTVTATAALQHGWLQQNTAAVQGTQGVVM